ncbi:MAG: hypothetical protein AB7O96_13050 [Pseudobdellovibrionaceae bacterium]
MKLIAILATSLILFSSQAFAFITVIDVNQANGERLTISNASEHSFGDLDGGFGMSYRGTPSGAIALFQALADKELPQKLTTYEFEVNPTTETVSVIVKVQGFFGETHSYFVIKKTGN